MSRFRKIAFSVIILLVACIGIYIYNQEKMVPIGLLTCSENEIPDNLPDLKYFGINYTYKEQENGSFIVYVKNRDYLYHKANFGAYIRATEDSSSDPTVRRVFMMATKNIRVIRDNADLQVQLQPETIQVLLQGPDKVITEIGNSGGLQAELDVSGLGVGEHELILHFDIPPNVSLENAEECTIHAIITD